MYTYVYTKVEQTFDCGGGILCSHNPCCAYFHALGNAASSNESYLCRHLHHRADLIWSCWFVMAMLVRAGSGNWGITA